MMRVLTDEESAENERQLRAELLAALEDTDFLTTREFDHHLRQGLRYVLSTVPKGPKRKALDEAQWERIKAERADFLTTYALRPASPTTH
jgi:hypothetical protein